jgi:hypothetical protein
LGSITGSYIDSNNVNHGFLYTSDGTLTTIDVPGSSETIPTCMNLAGAIAGYFSDSVGTHGFLRAPDGTFTTFDAAKKKAMHGKGTFVTSINKYGEIAGYYQR